MSIKQPSRPARRRHQALGVTVTILALGGLLTPEASAAIAPLTLAVLLWMLGAGMVILIRRNHV